MFHNFKSEKKAKHFYRETVFGKNEKKIDEAIVEQMAVIMAREKI